MPLAKYDGPGLSFLRPGKNIALCGGLPTKAAFEQVWVGSGRKSRQERCEAIDGDSHGHKSDKSAARLAK
jgi:hypothetical protein